MTVMAQRGCVTRPRGASASACSSSCVCSCAVCRLCVLVGNVRASVSMGDIACTLLGSTRDPRHHRPGAGTRMRGRTGGGTRHSVSARGHATRVVAHLRVDVPAHDAPHARPSHASSRGRARRRRRDAACGTQQTNAARLDDACGEDDQARRRAARVARRVRDVRPRGSGHGASSAAIAAPRAARRRTGTVARNESSARDVHSQHVGGEKKKQSAAFSRRAQRRRIAPSQTSPSPADHVERDSSDQHVSIPVGHRVKVPQYRQWRASVADVIAP